MKERFWFYEKLKNKEPCIRLSERCARAKHAMSNSDKTCC